MCQRLFLGSDVPLPVLDLEEGGGDFEVRAVAEDRGLRKRLGVKHLVEAVTSDGCACDLNVQDQESVVAMMPDDVEETECLARCAACARCLHDYVAGVAARGPVVAYVCWHEEEGKAPGKRQDVDLDWFLRPALDDVNGRVLRVRRPPDAPIEDGRP